MKKIFAMLLVLAMVFSMVACGAKEEAAPKSEAASEASTEAEAAPESEASSEAEATSEAEPAPAEEEHEPVDLNLWFIATNEVPQYILDWPETVKKYYPWINLTCEHIPDNAISERVSVAYATNACPDLLFDNYSRIAPAVVGGMAVELTDVYEANKDIFFSETLEGMLDGKYYYLPVWADAPYGITVNMTMAKELGVADMLPAPGEPWSYEQFLEVCRAAKAADPNIFPFALFAASQSSDAWDYGMFLGNGAAILNEDHTASVVNEPGNREKIIEVLELYQTLAQEHLIPDGAATMTNGDCAAMLRAGQLLMQCGGFNAPVDLYRQQEDGDCVEFEPSSVVQPTSSGELGNTASFGTGGLAVFNSNGKAEAAKLVVDAVMKDQAWRESMIRISGYFPITVDVTAEYATPELTELMAIGVDYGAKHSDANFGILEPFWSDCRTVFYPLKQDLFTGNITPEQFCEKWDEALNNVLSNYNAG